MLNKVEILVMLDDEDKILRDEIINYLDLKKSEIEKDIKRIIFERRSIIVFLSILLLGVQKNQLYLLL
jgi:ABC-type enterochelin transport system ATPase subunit